MNDLKKILDGFSVSEMRSSLYFLGRYIKQAAIFNDYEKDIFDDEMHSVPSEAVKALTIRMIEFIEETAKKKAADFSEDEFYHWMDQIAEIEDSLDPKPNESEISNALKQIDQFEKPNQTNLDIS